MYLVACKKAKLSINDMEYMTIGMCLEYIDTWVDSFGQKNESNNKPKVRKATQADFNAF